MIFERRGLPVWDDVQLACALGLVVPRSHRLEYPCAAFSDDEESWGVHPHRPGYDVRGFLDSNAVPLLCTFFKANEVPRDSAADFLADNIRRDHDILVGYSFSTVFRAGTDVGHAGLVTGVDPRADTVALIEPEEPAVKGVQMQQLLRGLYHARDGYWVFTEPSALIASTYPA
jgi:hypothetical protein